MNSLLTLGARTPHFALGSLWTCDSCKSLFTLRALFSSRTSLSSFSSLSFWSYRASRTCITFRTHRTTITLRANCPWISLNPLWTNASWISFWSRIPTYPLGTSRTSRPCCASWPCRARTATVSFRALRTHRTTLPTYSLRPLRTRRTLWTSRPLDCHKRIIRLRTGTIIIAIGITISKIVHIY